MAAVSVVEEKEVVSTVGFFSSEDLKSNNFPDGAVDVTRKESFLSDEEFTVVFGMDKEAFASLANWTRISARKKAGLF
jgi:hypothetical protein